MVLGMSLATFTALHVVISLIGIVAGVVVLAAMLNSREPAGWTALFLAATVLTSVTGFLFPATGFTPGQAIGIVSLVALALALFALYGRRLGGAWRWIYVVTALLALYLNCFVAVVQSFQKLSFLSALAPTQSEAPFQAAQLLLLAIFIAAAVFALRKFHPEGRPSVALKASTP